MFTEKLCVNLKKSTTEKRQTADFAAQQHLVEGAILVVVETRHDRVEQGTKL